MELSQLNKRRADLQSSAFYYLALSSRMVCQNVDSIGRYKKHIKNPQFYIKTYDLKALFGVKSSKEVTDILTRLKQDYHAIEFYKSKDDYYFHLKIGLTNQLSNNTYHKMVDGKYTPESKLQYYISNNEGYFPVSKIDIFNCFYKDSNKRGIKHGILDLFILLYLNQVTESEYTQNVLPRKLNDYRCCLWRVIENPAENYCPPALVFIIRKADLAKFLNITEKTIYRNLKVLDKFGLISYIPFGARGGCVIIQELDDDEREYIKSTLDSFIASYNLQNAQYDKKYSLKKDAVIQGLHVESEHLEEAPMEYRSLKTSGMSSNDSAARKPDHGVKLRVFEKAETEDFEEDEFDDTESLGTEFPPPGAKTEMTSPDYSGYTPDTTYMTYDSESEDEAAYYENLYYEEVIKPQLEKNKDEEKHSETPLCSSKSKDEPTDRPSAQYLPIEYFEEILDEDEEILPDAA